MIKLSKKGYYAIKTLIFMANPENKNFTKTLGIAKELDIPESLLRKIIFELWKSGIILTVKWINWWIYIWKELKNISIYDILLAVWEELGLVECTSGVTCDKSHNCNSKDIYGILQKSFNWVLKLYTLDKIIKRDL